MKCEHIMVLKDSDKFDIESLSAFKSFSHILQYKLPGPVTQARKLILSKYFSLIILNTIYEYRYARRILRIPRVCLKMIE